VKSDQQAGGLRGRIGWLIAGEGFARLTRLVTAIALARYLTPFEFGIAAIVVACSELIQVITRNGIGIRIIQASDEQLDPTCQGVYKINWGLSIGIAALQFAIAIPVASFFNYPDLANMLMVLSLTYLIYPFAMVQVYRVQRRQAMKTTSSIYATQVGTDNLLCALLAILGFGIWSIVIPKLVVAPLWVFCYRKVESWRFQLGAPSIGLNQVWQFSRDIFVVELLKTARANLDRLLIGTFLGVEALGIYHFAINAGSGMSMALISAYNTAVVPHLCQAEKVVKAATEKFKEALKHFSVLIVPIIMVQLMLAPWYVPIVFGPQWVHAIPILMILCAAAILRGYSEVITAVLRVLNLTGFDLKLNAIFSLTYLLAVIASVQLNIMAVATAVLAVHVVIVPLIGFYVYRALKASRDTTTLEPVGAT